MEQDKNLQEQPGESKAEKRYGAEYSETLGSDHHTDEVSIEDDALYDQMNTDASHQYVTFEVNREEYGIPILNVQEIVSIPEVTNIPNTPDYIRGVINLRGRIIPLFDMRIKFNHDVRELTEKSVVIVINITSENGTERVIGIIVDVVSDVLSFTEENLQNVPAFSTNIDTKFIQSMGKINDRLVIILDLNKLLTDKEEEALEQIAK